MAGSLRAFGQLGLREQVADMLTRDTEGIGMVLTVYRDTGRPHGCNARLVSGICLKDYEEGQKKGTISEEIHGRFLELPLVVRRLVDMMSTSAPTTPLVRPLALTSSSRSCAGQDCRSVTWTRCSLLGIP